MDPEITQVMDRVKAQAAAGKERIELDDADMIALFKATVDKLGTLDGKGPLGQEWGFNFLEQRFEWWPDGLSGKRHEIHVAQVA